MRTHTQSLGRLVLGSRQRLNNSTKARLQRLQAWTSELCLCRSALKAVTLSMNFRGCNVCGVLSMVRIESYAWLLPAAEFHKLDHDSLPTACICPTSAAALAAALVAISSQSCSLKGKEERQRL